jgi:hypothetical protein
MCLSSHCPFLRLVVDGESVIRTLVLAQWYVVTYHSLSKFIPVYPSLSDFPGESTGFHGSMFSQNGVSGH